MSDIIEQAIKEANEVQSTEKVSSEPSSQVLNGENTEQTEEEVLKNAESEEGEVIFPKKAVNAIARRDKKIAKLQAQYQQALNELSQSKESKAKESPRPSADDFETFDDYIDALVDFRNSQKSQPETKQEPITQEQVQERVYYQQRATVMDARDAEMSQKFPDYATLRDANADVLNNLSAEVVKAIYELDDAPLALYALAKENRLEKLLDMSSFKATIELARAEERGKQYLQKTITRAPAPINQVRGKSNNNSKLLEGMSAEELMAWARK